ncbi:MAG TPA: hypothetical protein VGC69_10875 [Bordetella sp.]
MTRQSGQGLVEALFALAALLACACAIAWTGSARHQAMQVAQASRAAAFMAARGGTPPAGRDGVRLELSRDRAGSMPSDERQAQLVQDWLRLDPRLVTARAERLVQPAGGWTFLSVGAVPVHRHTSVAQVGGHAESDMDGQRRILDSRIGWRQAADPSQSLSQRLRQHLAGIDAAWGERKPDADWVSAWPGLVPAEKLTNGGRP